MALKRPEDRIETLLLENAITPSSSALDENSQDYAEAFFEIQELMLEEPQLGLPQLEAFETKVIGQLKVIEDGFFSAAGQINWNGNTDPLLQDLLNLRSQRQYLISLLQNLERLNQNV